MASNGTKHIFNENLRVVTLTAFPKAGQTQKQGIIQVKNFRNPTLQGLPAYVTLLPYAYG
jgi:hypothetical protein